MPDLEAFRAYLEENQKAFNVWGRYVVQKIKRGLAGAQQSPNSFPVHIKIPPEPRIKDVDSAVKKVPRKNYDDPMR